MSGTQVPNFIVPTAPFGTSNNQAASTEFVQGAVSAVTITGLTNHGIVLGQGASPIIATAGMTDGQLLVGQTGADPLPKTISGDLTLSAAGALVIANAAVSYAKIQNVAASRLLGNPTGGAAAPSEISLNGTLSFTGTSLQREALSGAIQASAGSNATTETIDLVFVIGDGTNVITTGINGQWSAPLDFAGTIVAWSIVAKQSGSISIDVLKTTFTNFDAGATHPVAGDKISASAPITFTTATKAQSSTLTGWTTGFSVNDILAFNVASITTCTQVVINIKVTKTS